MTMMIRLLILLSLTAFFSKSANSQEEPPNPWKRSGKLSLNFSQSHFSNWAAGGQSALNTLGLFNYVAQYSKDKIKWDNSVDINLGYSILGEAKAMKTDDKIEINSLLGRKHSETVYFSFTFSFKTQMTDGFNYKVDSTNPISRLLAPAYLTLGLGIDWKPNKYFSLNFSPLTGRMLIVADKKLSESGAFGIDPGKTLHYNLGSKSTAKLQVDIAKNVNLNSKFELFSDYLDKPLNFKIDWQNQITMKVNSLLNANISTHLIYDEDIMITDKKGKKGPRTQFKEVLSVGITYGF